MIHFKINSNPPVYIFIKRHRWVPQPLLKRGYDSSRAASTRQFRHLLHVGVHFVRLSSMFRVRLLRGVAGSGAGGQRHNHK